MAIIKGNVEGNTVFCESTIEALRYYSNHSEFSDWNFTADFCELFLNYWKILNVRSPSTGKHKRDSFRDPIRSSLDWKLKFLEKFGTYISSWESNFPRNHALSRETFFALKQTTRAIQDMAKLNDIDIHSTTSKDDDTSLCPSDVQIAEELDKHLQDSSLIDPDDDDLVSIYYVSGYVARSLTNKYNCISCNEIVRDNSPHPHVDDSFYNLMNRGGLCKPSENSLELCTLSHRIYRTIMHTDFSKKLFLKASNTKQVFLFLASHGSSFLPVVTECEMRHDICQPLFKAMFNIMTKNFISENSSVDKSKKLCKF